MPIEHGNDPSAQGKQTVFVLLAGMTIFVTLIGLIGCVQTYLENPNWGWRFVLQFFRRLLGL